MGTDKDVYGTRFYYSKIPRHHHAGYPNRRPAPAHHPAPRPAMVSRAVAGGKEMNGNDQQQRQD